MGFYNEGGIRKQPCPAAKPQRKMRKRPYGNAVKIRGSPLYCKGDASAKTPLPFWGEKAAESE